MPLHLYGASSFDRRSKMARRHEQVVWSLAGERHHNGFSTIVFADQFSMCVTGTILTPLSLIKQRLCHYFRVVLPVCMEGNVPTPRFVRPSWQPAVSHRGASVQPAAQTLFEIHATCRSRSPCRGQGAHIARFSASAGPRRDACLHAALARRVPGGIGRCRRSAGLGQGHRLPPMSGARCVCVCVSGALRRQVGKHRCLRTP